MLRFFSLIMKEIFSLAFFHYCFQEQLFKHTLFYFSAAPVAKRYAHTSCCILHSLYCPTAGILPSKITLESSWNEIPGTGEKEYLELASWLLIQNNYSSSSPTDLCKQSKFIRWGAYALMTIIRYILNWLWLYSEKQNRCLSFLIHPNELLQEESKFIGEECL